MSFDAKKFANTDFVPRTKEVSLPGLASFFPPPQLPVFTVRSITGEELARCQEEVEKNKQGRRALMAAAHTASAEVAAAVRTLLTGVRGGSGADTPDGYILSLNIVHTALVDPVLEYSQIVRLATAFPVEFGALRIAALELLGMGHEPKKALGSTPSPE